MDARTRKQASTPYVLGKSSFAAISAVEGLRLTRDAEARLQHTHTLSPAQRRAETIRAFVENRKRG